MGDLRDSMQIQANSYDWFDEENVTAWMKWATENGPCKVRLYTGLTDQGLRQQFLVACPVSAKAEDVETMLDEGSTHPGVMELSDPCPPFCP